MKNMMHVNRDYESELKEGDYVVVQLFKMEEVEYDLRTTSFEVMRIEMIDKHNIAFKPKGASFYLPLYRIKQVVDMETELSYNYKGYDYNHILMDECQITCETFNELERQRNDEMA